MEQWFRTCQECGHSQRAKPPDPNKELTDAYRNALCRRCKSSALDYGKLMVDVFPDKEKKDG